MKVVKRLCLLSFLCLIIAVSLCNDKLVAFANGFLYTYDTLPSGTIMKSGDYFTFDFENEMYSSCSAPVTLMLEYNNYQYLSYVDSETGMLFNTPGFYYAGGLNTDAFSQNKAPELPYVEGKTVLWKYQGYEDGIGGYCMTRNHFVGVVYEEPEFELYCDSTEIDGKEKVACQVAVEYSFVPENVQFDLSSELFDISDVTVLDGWKRTDEDKFIFESLDVPTNKYDDSRVSVDIIEFFVNPKNDDVTKNDEAIKLENIAWKDEYVEKESDEVHYEFVFIHPFSDGNGRTGVESSLLLAAVLLSIGAIVYRYISMKGLFKRL